MSKFYVSSSEDIFVTEGVDIEASLVVVDLAKFQVVETLEEAFSVENVKQVCEFDTSSIEGRRLFSLIKAAVSGTIPEKFPVTPRKIFDIKTHVIG